MRQVDEAEIKEIVDDFNIDISPKLIEVRKKLRLYKVTEEDFIIDTPEARTLACFPHIVSDAFIDLNKRAAMKASEVIIERHGLDERDVVILHILRAGPGYMLHEAFKARNIKIKELYVRPKYIESSFKDHVDKVIKIVYHDAFRFSGCDRISLIIPDTIATGKTSIEVLKFYKKDLKDKVEEIILYGFISRKGLANIRRFLEEEYNTIVYSYSLVDLTALASNNYDMPIYGPDENLMVKYGEEKLLGSTIGYETLRDCINYYFPGIDQPGDWSARQTLLFTGTGYEKANYLEHLQNMKKSIERLLSMSRRRQWFRKIYEEIAKGHIKAIDKVYYALYVQ